MKGTYFYGDGSTAYAAIAKEVLLHGATCAPRGLRCKELVNTTVVIADASQAVPVNAGRKVSRRIGAAEYCQLLAGVSSLSMLDAVSNGKFSEYASSGKLRGAYGPRVYDQLPWIATLLDHDPDSRQAVVTIWRTYNKEAGQPGKDVPCTVSLQFRRRERKLSMAVMMRSSDVWLGIPYDWWQFSRLQMTMAWALGLQPGAFTFFAGSLHVYDQDAEKARGLLRTSDISEQPPAIEGHEAGIPRSPAARLQDAQDIAQHLIVLADRGCDAPGAQWYASVLPVQEPGYFLCLSCRYIVKRNGDDFMCEECRDHSAAGGR